MKSSDLPTQLAVFIVQSVNLHILSVSIAVVFTIYEKMKKKSLDRANKLWTVLAPIYFADILLCKIIAWLGVWNILKLGVTIGMVLNDFEQATNLYDSRVVPTWKGLRDLNKLKDRYWPRRNENHNSKQHENEYVPRHKGYFKYGTRVYNNNESIPDPANPHGLDKLKSYREVDNVPSNRTSSGNGHGNMSEKGYFNGVVEDAFGNVGGVLHSIKSAFLGGGKVKCLQCYYVAHYEPP